MHEGTDLAGSMGTAVKSIGAGRVVRASWYGGYGNCVDIQHDNGVMTRYGHNSSVTVSVGDRVSAGDTIARLGSTGDSSGPHIHFEVHVGGSPVNPVPWMSNRGVNL